MDLGICMSVGTLAHKLAARDEKNPEQAWNLTRWPRGLSVAGEHRLFVAAGGAWRGYFRLAADALFNPRDLRVPYTLLFDTRTWTLIPPLPVRFFRGFTYEVPRLAAEPAVSPPPEPGPTPPPERAHRPSSRSGDHRQ